MPLLKKSLKLSLSQASRSKDFKIPLKHNRNIKDIIENTSSETPTKNGYKAFARKLSKGNYENRSSSPKSVSFENEENENKKGQKLKKNQKPKKSKGEIEEKIKEAELSIDSTKSLSQEELNKPGVKAAYVEYMNNVLSQTNSEKQENVETELSLDTNVSLSQDELNQPKVRAAYIEFMNSTFEKDNNKTRKRSLVIYSSSEEVTSEFKKVSRQKIISRMNSKGSDKSNTKTKVIKSIKESEVSKKSKLKTTTPKSMVKVASKSSKSSEPKKISKKNKAAAKKHTEKETNVIRKEDSKDEFKDLPLEDKMLKLYDMRNVGHYVLCDTCNKARYLPDVVDPLDLPDKWHCFMNPDKKHNSCTAPEEVTENLDILVNNIYNSGSVVYARIDGYPWWPAMVEDDPDVECFYWLKDNSMTPSHYHVTFFDSAEVTRAWVRPEKIAPFKKNLRNPEFRIPEKHRYKVRLTIAYEQALDALDMAPFERLKNFGFIKRYKNVFKRVVNSDNHNRKKRIRKHKSVLALDERVVSEILGDMNLSDLSFNLLD